MTLSPTEHLSGVTGFRLHTGNINKFTHLKMTHHKSSAAELSVCLKFLLEKAPSGLEDTEANSQILLSDNDDMDKYNRNDLKVTLKVFLTSWNALHLEEALESIKRQLKIADVDNLIVSFPELNLVKDESEDEKHKRWFACVEPLYNKLEELVFASDVSAIGVADFSAVQLQEILDKCSVKPLINHISGDQCCTISEELRRLAQVHEIQLLCHNDTRQFDEKEISGILKNKSDNSSKLKTSWIANYTIWMRTRAILVSKGWVIQFEK